MIMMLIPVSIFAEDDNGMYGGTGSLKIFPESGPKNNVVRIDATGFLPEEEIEIYIYKSLEEIIFIKSVLSDNKGDFNFSFLVPSNIGIGSYKIEVRGSESIMWADYYVTSETRLNLRTFLLSVAGAFLLGAGIMYLVLKLVYKRLGKI